MVEERKERAKKKNKKNRVGIRLGQVDSDQTRPDRIRVRF